MSRQRVSFSHAEDEPVHLAVLEAGVDQQHTPVPVTGDELGDTRRQVPGHSAGDKGVSGRQVFVRKIGGALGLGEVRRDWRRLVSARVDRDDELARRAGMERQGDRPG